MYKFFNEEPTALVENPGGPSIWWHSAPLPDGRRIKGAHDDVDRQFKMWRGMGITPGSLIGKSVLDIGANDGFFSVAARVCDARVTALNTADWITWPKNIRYLSEAWGADIDIVTDDFRTYPFQKTFDVIFFLGVIYHVENVFGCMQRLQSLLAPGGRLYIETHLSPLGGGLPVWEAASDTYATSAPQGRTNVGRAGISNFLLPNAEAICALAETYGMKAKPLLDNPYCQDDRTRGLLLVEHAA